MAGDNTGFYDAPQKPSNSLEGILWQAESERASIGEFQERGLYIPDLGGSQK